MSIKEIQGKIKATLEHHLLLDRVFIPAVIVLVALGSFGLGRLSTMTPKGQDATPTVAITMPTSAAALPSVSNSVIQSETPTSTEYRAPNVASTTGMYVGSKSSDKYHLPWCSGARRISEANKIWFASKEEAERAGYKPAANCPGI